MDKHYWCRRNEESQGKPKHSLYTTIQEYQKPIQSQRCNELHQSKSYHIAETHYTRMTDRSGLRVYTYGSLHKRNIVRTQPTIFSHYPGTTENLASSGNLCCFPNFSQEMTFPTFTLLERGVIKGERVKERAREKKE